MPKKLIPKRYITTTDRNGNTIKLAEVGGTTYLVHSDGFLVRHAGVEFRNALLNGHKTRPQFRYASLNSLEVGWDENNATVDFWVYKPNDGMQTVPAEANIDPSQIAPFFIGKDPKITIKVPRKSITPWCQGKIYDLWAIFDGAELEEEETNGGSEAPSER